MKYLFNLLNIVFLTATMFLIVQTLYKHLDASLMKPHYDIYPNDKELEDKRDTRSSGVSPSSGKSALFQPRSHYDIIHKRDIFKTSGEVVDNKEVESISEKEIASLEKTDLRLKLWGTVTGSDKTGKITAGKEFTESLSTKKEIDNYPYGKQYLQKKTENKDFQKRENAIDNTNTEYAVIETEKDKRQALYKKGDEIEGATIKKILRFSVILSRNGKDEKLEMTEESLSDQSSRAAAKSSVSKSSHSMGSEDKMEISIKRSLIEESMQDINALMSQVRAKPHFTGGNADGILLYGIKQSSMFKDMGIQNGDIIMGVDGTEIKSVEDAISLYDRLKNSQDVRMQIRRRGQIKEILYHVE
ncbi:MAG: PDZ domain-containing protein [Desulfamplus sp.]|nr:PDZ domain-containing protein [Desulfamplus sp.]